MIPLQNLKDFNVKTLDKLVALLVTVVLLQLVSAQAHAILCSAIFSAGGNETKPGIHWSTFKSIQDSKKSGVRYDQDLEHLSIPGGVAKSYYTEAYLRLREMGYSDSIIQRIIFYRIKKYGTTEKSLANFMDSLSEVSMSGRTKRFRAVTMYRGINSSTYSPKFKEGLMIGAGRKWMTTSWTEAIGFTGEPLERGESLPGYLIEYEIPETLLNYWSGRGRAYVKTSELRDDRLYLRRLGVVISSRQVNWYTYEEAVQNGFFSAFN